VVRITEKKKRTKGKVNANLVMTGKTENDSEKDIIFYTSCASDKNNTWIIDSSATDHMIFSSNDVINKIEPRKT
jgi:hypothetical protein